METPHSPLLAPSILAGNHARLAESLQEIIAAQSPWVHLDIMDGHFVPNLTFGPETVRRLREEAPDSLFFDVHLMMDNPQVYIEAFAEAGANLISIHIEPEALPVAETLRKIRSLNCKNGIVLNPPTPVETIKPFIEEVDLILVMTVQPGFGGQSFQDQCLNKIALLHKLRCEEGMGNFRIEVDGGINESTGIACRNAGADTFVCGTAFFNGENRAALIRSLTGDK